MSDAPNRPATCTVKIDINDLNDDNRTKICSEYEDHGLVASVELEGTEGNGRICRLVIGLDFSASPEHTYDQKAIIFREEVEDRVGRLLNAQRSRVQPASNRSSGGKQSKKFVHNGGRGRGGSIR